MSDLSLYQLPDYESFPKRALRQAVDDLTADVGQYFPRILGKKVDRKVHERLTQFASRQYERYVQSTGPYALCTVHEFEREVGPLPEAEQLDAPPYTEILMQGIRGVAFRHPEYMLARDIEFLHALYCQVAELVVKHGRQSYVETWIPNASENVQALARAVILACFSMIEGFISGLALSYVMRNPGLDSATKKKLLNNHGPLLDRTLAVPSLVRGEQFPLTGESLPLSRLFGEIKQRRDAFVHCEPGEQEARAGFVKQTRFHDVGAEVVDASVQLTADLIRKTWQWVHRTESGPVWVRFGMRDDRRSGVRVEPAV